MNAQTMAMPPSGMHPMGPPMSMAPNGMPPQMSMAPNSGMPPSMAMAPNGMVPSMASSMPPPNVAPKEPTIPMLYQRAEEATLNDDYENAEKAYNSIIVRFVMSYGRDSHRLVEPYIKLAGMYLMENRIDQAQKYTDLATKMCANTKRWDMELGDLREMLEACKMASAH